MDGVDPGKVTEAFAAAINGAITLLEKAFDTAVMTINSYDAAGNLVQNAASQMPALTEPSVRHDGFRPTV